MAEEKNQHTKPALPAIRWSALLGAFGVGMLCVALTGFGGFFDSWTWFCITFTVPCGLMLGFTFIPILADLRDEAKERSKARERIENKSKAS